MHLTLPRAADQTRDPERRRVPPSAQAGAAPGMGRSSDGSRRHSRLLPGERRGGRRAHRAALRGHLGFPRAARAERRLVAVAPDTRKRGADRLRQRARGLAVRADPRREDRVGLVVLVVAFVIQLASGIDVMQQPGDSGSVNTIAFLVVVCFLIGIARAWELVGGPSIGIAHEVVALVRSEEQARAGRAAAAGSTETETEPEAEHEV